MTSDSEVEPEPREAPGGAPFWIGAVVGIGIMAYGVKGLLDAAPSTQPNQVGVSLLGLDLLHDAIVAPIVCLVGVLLARLLPRRVRGPVRAGLFASAIVILVGWAALRGYGHDQVPDNPTVDPLNYGTAVLTVLAVVWAGVVIWAIAASWLGRRAERPEGRGARGR
ncbi:MAG TPA: hypothetical protein VGN59_12275 [Acidimicrobiia bacterium]|jgi:hypothetical protein